MNATPHAHRLEVRDHGAWWAIEYGDQLTKVPNKPWRWTRFWESDEDYALRCMRALVGHVKRVIQTHDRASRVAALHSFALPVFEAAEWGSDQLERWQKQ